MTCIIDLPEEILEKIFIFTTPWFNESITISHVCKHWRRAMERRLSLVKYILPIVYVQQSCSPHESGRFLLGDQEDVLKYHRFLPNLMVFPIDYLPHTLAKPFSDLIKCIPNFRGLYNLDRSGTPSAYFHQLLSYKVELLSIEESRVLDDSNLNENCITQLRVKNYVSGHKLNGFSNLKRLQIQGSFGDLWSSMLAQSQMENLEILEMSCFSWLEDEDRLATFSDSLRLYPKLRSLFLSYQSFFNWTRTSIEYYHHEGVENIVLDSQNSQDLSILWVSTLFPNLKNLALRSKASFTPSIAMRTQENIQGVLKLSPKLEYLEIIGTDILTDSYLKPENLISVFFNLHGRTIRCHVGNQLPKEPGIYDKLIAEGFDFMNNIFPRKFEDLPHFLIEERPKSTEQRWL